MRAQLTLLEPDRLTAKEAGLRTHVPHGPAQVLAALVKRGLQREDAHEAARIIIAWDLHAPLDDPELDTDWSTEWGAAA